jgi:HAD superfamily hydrolase (TIGR01509 family)
MTAHPYRFVLFDLGGVLVRLGDRGPMAGLAPPLDHGAFWARWLASPWVRAYERGQCGDHDFAVGVVAEWDLKATPAEFLAAFARWPEGLFDGAAALVDAVRKMLPVGCLSNSNPVHWSMFTSAWGLDDLFDLHLLSHQLGAVKPDPELFASAVAVLDLPPPSVVFLDDNQQNVDAADQAGITAFRVCGPDEAAEALRQLGILPPKPARHVQA